MEENELSQEEALDLWNEEAKKLDAGDNTPAFEAQGTAPETPQEIIDPQATAPAIEQPVDHWLTFLNQ